MAVLGSITLNEIMILEVDENPAISGVQAPSGSMAIMTDGSGTFLKGEGNDFDWIKQNTPLTNSIPVNVTKAAAAVGVSTEAARADHKHDIATGLPSSLTPNQANAQGVSTNLARADHIHNIAAAIASTIGTNTVNAEGTASSFARSDHTHEVNLPNSQAYAAGNTTTTSATDTLLDSMSITPGAGTYLVIFVSSINHSTNNAVVTISIYANAAKVADTEISLIPRSNNQSSLRVPIMNVGVATVAAGQAIDIRWRTTAATATANQRKLQLVRIS